MKPNLKIMAIAALVLGSMHVAHADLIRNDLTNWVAITVGGGLYNDPSDKNPGSSDLLGDSTHAAGFWQLDEGGSLSFRLRVSALPKNPQSVWQILMNTDTNDSNIEWILQLSYSGRDNGVFLTQTTSTGDDLYLGDIETLSTNAWEGTTTGFSQMTLAGTDLDGQKADAFIDFGIPWQDFEIITGLSSINDLEVAITTSTTHSGINKDAPLGTDGPGSLLISDALSETIPEPAVLTLLLGTGGGCWPSAASSITTRETATKVRRKPHTVFRRTTGFEILETGFFVV